MHPDNEKYRHYVDGFDLTEDQKEELIHTVRQIMKSFAQRAFALAEAGETIEPQYGTDSNGAANTLEYGSSALAIEFERADETASEGTA